MVNDFKKYQSLSLFGKKHQSSELIKLAISKIQDQKTEAWEKNIFWFILEWLHPSDKVNVSTSGSTGKAKTIQFLKKQMLASALASKNFFNYSENDPVLLALDIFYIAAKMMVVRAFVSKLDLFYVKPSSDPFKGNNFPKFAFVPLVPYQLKSIFQSPSSIDALRNTSKILVGGGALDSELEQLIQQENNSYYASFGMAETLTHFAIKKINGPNNTSEYRALERIKLKVDQNGCLQVLVPWISSNFISTRDLVELVGNNGFIWKGRFDNLINSGGIKMSPESIEAKLVSHIPFPFFIATFPDPLLGEKIILLVETTSIDKNWYNIFDRELEKYERPKEIYSIPHFVYTSSNKINRKKTQALVFLNR